MTANTGDLYWHDTLLLLKFEGSNGSTTIADSSKRGYAYMLAQNGMAISTSQYLFGTSSGYFDGSNDILQFNGASGNIDGAFNIGTGDFCVECWIYVVATPALTAYFFYGNGTNLVPPLYVGDDLKLTTIDSAWRYSTNTVPTGEFCHIAYDRKSGAGKLFINGVQGASFTNTRSYSLGTSSFYIGSGYNGSILRPLNCYVDSLRVTKRSRYQSNFTPPDAPFPESPFQGMPVKDNSLRKPLKVNGNTFIHRSGI